jgi:hypothetical protein
VPQLVVSSTLPQDFAGAFNARQRRASIYMRQHAIQQIE